MVKIINFVDKMVKRGKWEILCDKIRYMFLCKMLKKGHRKFFDEFNFCV